MRQCFCFTTLSPRHRVFSPPSLLFPLLSSSPYLLLSFVSAQYSVIINADGTTTTPTGAIVGSTFAATSTSGVVVTLNVVVAVQADVGISGAAAASLPFGSTGAAFTGGVTAQLGYKVTASATGNANPAFQLVITTPAITGYTTLTSSGNIFNVVYYDATAQTYMVLPPQQAVFSANGVVTITAKLQGSYFITYSATAGATAALNTPYVVASNQSYTFRVAEGATANALVLANVVCQSGSITIQESAAVTEQTAAAGKRLVSKVYSFTHSAGGAAVTSAMLTFDTSKSATYAAATQFTAASAQWYLYVNSQWQLQGGSVSGSTVVYTAGHFSDWSVQATAATSAAFGMASSLSFGIMNMVIIAVVMIENGSGLNFTRVIVQCWTR